MGLLSGIRSIAIPAKASGTNVSKRLTDYGDDFHVALLTAPQGAAWEGSRFAAMATPVVAGSGVVLGSFPTVYSDTAKISVLIKNAEAAGGKSYVLDHLRARVIVADTNGTSMTVRAEIDSKDRTSSGGTALTVGNVNPGANQPVSAAVVTVGDVTCAAAGTFRTHLGHTLIKKRSAPVLTVDDTYVFTFGGGASLTPSAVAGQLITTLQETVVPFGPAVIPPGGSFILQLAIVAGDTTPAQLCWEAFWTER